MVRALKCVLVLALVGCESKVPRAPDQQAPPAPPKPFVESPDQRAQREAAIRLLTPGPAHDPKQGLSLLEACCELGNPSCCTDASYHLSKGEDANPARAFAYARRACEQNQPLGCANQGSWLRKGKGVTANEELALVVLEKSCALEEPWGCELAGRLLVESTSGDRDRGSLHLEKACFAGEASACEYLISKDTWELSEIVLSSRRQAEFTRLGCEQGSAFCCRSWGYLLDTGTADVPQDRLAALEVWQKACPEDPTACAFAGVSWELGVPGTPDLRRANRFYRQACELDDFQGCRFLAANTRDGKGLKRNLVQARKLFEKACAAGDGKGCVEVAAMHEAGAPGGEDPTRVKELLARACELGEARYCTQADLAAKPDDRQACEAGQARACTRVAYAIVDQYEAHMAAQGLGQREGEDEHQLRFRRLEHRLTLIKREGAIGETWLWASQMSSARSLLKKACRLGDELACQD